MKSISELVGELRDQLGVEPISKVVDFPEVEIPQSTDRAMSNVLRCQVCGRFFPVGGRCSLVSYDKCYGAWEHD